MSTISGGTTRINHNTTTGNSLPHLPSTTIQTLSETMTPNRNRIIATLQDELNAADILTNLLGKTLAAGVPMPALGHGHVSTSKSHLIFQLPYRTQAKSKHKRSKKEQVDGGGIRQRSSTASRFKPFHEERWDQMLSKFLDFREEHRHVLVPHTYPPNPQLARWVKRQRRQYKLIKEGKPSTMTLERAKVLEKEGFVWDSHEAAWQEKIRDLRKYRGVHNNCLVPSNYKGDPHLATWYVCRLSAVVQMTKE